VTNLVESPTVISGSFSDAFLHLPATVLVMVMRKHQRYFPVYSASTGALSNTFVAVSNGPVDVSTVRAGNEAVLRARFQDASFFYQEDLKMPLEDFVPKLRGTVFQYKLGSMYDKVLRTRGLVPRVAHALGLDDEGVVATASEAAYLGRADLATAVVTEMTALAGVMGRHYASKQGKPEVCYFAMATAASHLLGADG
jgi:glycyl-tRNA synthetase